MQHFLQLAMKAVVRPLSGKANKHPATPPIPASRIDSKKKLKRILPRENPRTLSVPISRARRATAAYIVFMAAKLHPAAMISGTRMPVKVEPHFFGGLTYEEVAAFLKIGRSAVIRELRTAQGWLKNYLVRTTAAAK